MSDLNERLVLAHSLLVKLNRDSFTQKDCEKLEELFAAYPLIESLCYACATSKAIKYIHEGKF